MKNSYTYIIALFTMVSNLSVAQTTVQFSEPHQFLDASNGFLNVKILVNNIDEYSSDEPIIIQVVSDLEDINALSITATKGMDIVIFPEQYFNGKEIRIPVNPEALRNSKSFKLSLIKKRENENFKIFQDVHAVILNQEIKNRSYVSIMAGIPVDSLKTDLINKSSKKIEIPFRMETRGYYLPVEADKVAAKVKIKGVEGSDSLGIYTLVGSESGHKIQIEKQKNPEIYKKVRKALASGEQLELEISGLENKSQQHIEIDPAERSARFSLKKTNKANVRSKKEKDIERLKKPDSLDARYSFYAGVNFDFNNNFKFEEAYYEVDVSLYNLFKNRWGLRAGIYKNNNSRSLEESFRYEWVNNELVEHNFEDVIYNSRILDVVANVSTESLGFYFELPYKVIESGNFSAFVSPHIELIKRIEKYTYEVVGEETEEIITVPIDDPVTSLRYATLWQENTTQYWDSYLGLGFSMQYRSPDKGFEVFINPIAGAGYPQQAADSVLFDEIENSGASFFGAFQFHLAISAKESLSFKLGADVRKYFFTGQKPTVSVNISTKLDLSNITGLTGGT